MNVYVVVSFWLRRRPRSHGTGLTSGPAADRGDDAVSDSPLRPLHEAADASARTRHSVSWHAESAMPRDPVNRRVRCDDLEGKRRGRGHPVSPTKLILEQVVQRLARQKIPHARLPGYV
jgi:hypothetical protein